MTTSDRMSDPMERLRAEIGYRMWCLDQGYMSDKDREGCDNWLLLPDSELHETDRRAKPEILELADSVIDALAAAGFRVVPIVDDATRKEVERLVADQIRAAAVAAVHDSPDLSPEDRESLQRIISFHSRTAELLDAAYLGEVG